MFELASDPIWAVTIHLVLSAHLGLIVDWKVNFHHHLILVVSEAASLTKLALACLLEVLAHFCSELVNLWSAHDILRFSWIS